MRANMWYVDNESDCLDITITMVKPLSA